MKHVQRIAAAILLGGCGAPDDDPFHGDESTLEQVPEQQEQQDRPLDAPLVAGSDDAVTLPQAPDSVAPAEEVGASSQALLGGTNYSTAVLGNGEPLCTDDDKAVFRQAMILGRTIAQTPAMAQCLDYVMRAGEGGNGPYQKCSGDPYSTSSLVTQIEKVQAVVKSANVVQIGCRGTGGGVTQPEDQHSYSYTGTERFDAGNTSLFNLRTVSVAENGSTWDEADRVFRYRVDKLAQTVDTVWHEAMHTHGYDHYPASGCGGSSTMLDSVPYLVEHCMKAVAQASIERCDMRGGCNTAGYVAIVGSYPATSTTSCGCYADAVGSTSSTTEHPATPRLDANEAGDQYGHSLATGDFNGDGFDDLAVGAPGEDSNTGRVYIYYGSVLGLTAAVELNQAGLGVEEAGDQFGWALAAADFNLDGEDDLAVGGPGENERTGAVFLFSGSREGLKPNRVLWQTDMSDNTVDDEFGYSLATGRFFSGARIALAVGAPGEDLWGKVDAGWVLLYAGDTGLAGLVAPWGRIREPEAQMTDNDRFGTSVAFGPTSTTLEHALAVGAPGDNGNRGKVAVFDGRTFGSSANVPNTALPSYAVTGSVSGALFGWSVALGDVGGYRGLAVGAPFQSNVSLWSGGVHYYRDQRVSGGGVTYHYTQLGGDAFHLFGYSMQHLVTGTLLVGAPGEAGGRVYRYASGFDSAAGEGRAIYRAAYSQVDQGANEDGDYYGIAIAVGDFDGSDTVEFAVGAENEAPGSDPASGAVFVRRALETGGWGRWSVHTQND